MATIRSDGKLADVALALVDQLGRERRLAVALRTLEEDYELVVVDAAPQLSLVSINVLNAVGELLVPVDAGAFSVAGLGRLQESVDQVRRYLDNHALRIAGLVMTRTHANRATKDIDSQLRAAYGPLVHQATIPHSVKVEEAHARCLTVLGLQGQGCGCKWLQVAARTRMVAASGCKDTHGIASGIASVATVGCKDTHGIGCKGLQGGLQGHAWHCQRHCQRSHCKAARTRMEAARTRMALPA
jgi:chromosome partitioning protein